MLQEMFERFGLKNFVPRALVFGAAGSGKSRAIRAAALRHKNVRLVVANMAEVFSPYVGESERRVTGWFKEVSHGGRGGLKTR